MNRKSLVVHIKKINDIFFSTMFYHYTILRVLVVVACLVVVTDQSMLHC